jgi:hypothetical protein
MARDADAQAHSGRRRHADGVSCAPLHAGGANGAGLWDGKMSGKCDPKSGAGMRSRLDVIRRSASCVDSKAVIEHGVRDLITGDRDFAGGSGRETAVCGKGSARASTRMRTRLRPLLEAESKSRRERVSSGAQETKLNEALTY